MKNRKAIPLIFYLLLLVSVFSWVSELFSDNLTKIPYSQVISLFRQEQVKAFEIQDDVITMEQIAEAAGSFHYEFVCGISRRVPRIYCRNGEDVPERIE